MRNDASKNQKTKGILGIVLSSYKTTVAKRIGMGLAFATVLAVSNIASFVAGALQNYSSISDRVFASEVKQTEIANQLTEIGTHVLGNAKGIEELKKVILDTNRDVDRNAAQIETILRLR